jgi:predicted enzyme related to lactoylglutathione lyase
MPLRDDAPIGAPCWIDLFSSDTDRSREFYGDLFGWTSEAGGPEFGGYITFSRDGVVVAGCMHNDGSGPPDFWTTYLAVEDAQKIVDATPDHGGVVHLAPMAVGDLGVMGMVADPSGAAIGLWQPGEHRGFGVLAEPGAPAWFELHTRDFGPAVAFYHDVFGWDVHAVGDSDEFRYSTLGEGDGALAGMMDAAAFLPESLPSYWAVYFAVDDVDASVAQAVALGATVLEPATDNPYGRLVQLADPTNAPFRLTGPNVG